MKGECNAEAMKKKGGAAGGGGGREKMNVRTPSTERQKKRQGERKCRVG